ncbi:hypothetical protein BP5796_09552 [Coleophoma crateriformis]|uniref:Eukaryotic mitochondrial regulator protein-domain-containing protein n=1 Tax=Coleophoma crateriformis TaxID=565419 RepID=A0A3D8QYA5_9HELO|nr:hypothetical protein BP5796_09552 [Coleophoma crateriformis]
MPPSMRWSSVIPSPQTCAKQICPNAHLRAFSSSTRSNAGRTTRQRRLMFQWLDSQGAAFRDPLPGSTNYLTAYDNHGVLKRVKMARGSDTSSKPADEQIDGDELSTLGAKSNDSEEADEASNNTKTGGDENRLPPEGRGDRRPFPHNKSFYSEPVLSEEFREEIWRRIMKDGMSVREVSATTGVEMRRVGAVVRLKEMEKAWLSSGTPLARPYAQAVMSMLPQTQWNTRLDARRPHEPINSLPVHEATTLQIFEPTSESRHFTREDAARAFDENLLSTDERIPHPEMVAKEKDLLAGLPAELVAKRARAREDAEIEAKQKQQDRIAKKEAAIKKVDTGRWQFRIQEVKVDDAGVDGRGPRGTGWRYGTPLMDRSRGQIKIPTRVD